MWIERLPVLALLLVVLSGCAPRSAAAAPDELVVFAAASLGDAFDAAGLAFARVYPELRVRSSYGGSSQLRIQLEHGAPADLFASADERQMAVARQSGVVAAAPRVFARNRLVAIIPASNPAGLRELRDLARPGLKIVTTQPDVPAGAYTRQLLDRLAAEPSYGPAYRTAVLANLASEEDNVRQVVAKVRLGQADAGFAYRTDVTPSAAEELAVLAIPDRFDQPSVYLVAPTAGARAPSAAERFVEFLLSAEGQTILDRYGFLPP